VAFLAAQEPRVGDDLHGIRTYRRPMTINDDQRRGRRIVSCMHVSLVFATNYRRGALDSAMP
jgi:hypothetical protein